MVLLRQQQAPSRKRSSSSSPFVPPFPPSKSAKTLQQNDVLETAPAVDTMVSVLADAGCTLINPAGPPCLPSDPHQFRRRLHRLFSSSQNAPSLRSDFLSGFSSYIHSSPNLRRVLISINHDGLSSTRSESIVRHLLLVPSVQLDLQSMLLEKLPEYFDASPEHSGGSLSLEDDIARLIINQFRWLDFIVDHNAFTNKLMQVLSICPSHLKKEIIGSLPEIIGDQNNKIVVEGLEQMLQEDSAIIVPVLDSLSNLNLDDQLQEQVITLALSCIRTIDVEHMPYLLRFLLLSATPVNVRRIVLHIREQLKFVGLSNSRASQHNKLKGKSLVGNTEASILDALRSSLRFRNFLCQEILKELNCLEKPRDHKVIDIWLLVLIYSKGESLQKSIEKMFKKKIIEDCIQEVMLDQCICGNKELVQDYFPSFLSLSEYLLACKEQRARGFGIHMYICLFEEFLDNYSRQEVLGALVSHVGSGVSFEVQSALETLFLLASKYAHDLLPLSCHINGILDYLEGFSVENLHKVYEVFSHLLLSARSSSDSYGSSVANELLMIVRKQVGNPDPKFKKMGLIGTLKLVSFMGDKSSASYGSTSQKSNCEEALELLKASLESCRRYPLPLILFYDELTTILDNGTLHPSIMELIVKHVGEFESVFLSDLEGGKMPSKESYCGLEGELWMNLDGDISPVCLNILPLASSSLQSASLQFLPANFLLLSTIERSTNQGSLEGIDALLGCPLHLPSSKYFYGAGWKSLTGKQKQIVGLSLYYATNWIRELLNAFCTVVGRIACTSQATKDDTVRKLLNRFRNLVYLEILLNNSIEQHSILLPELHCYVDHFGSPLLNHSNHTGHVEKNNQQKTQECTLPKSNRRGKKISKASSSDTNRKLQQPTILDVLKKAGTMTSQEVTNMESSGLISQGSSSKSQDQYLCDPDKLVTIDVSPVAKALETQRYKFRPLLVQCFSILRFSELPLFLYLLRDLHYKLDYFTPAKQFLARNPSPPAGFTRMAVNEFLTKITPLFPSLRKHFSSALFILKGSDETCQEHWNVYSSSAENPDVPNLVLSRSGVSMSTFKETLHCFRKMLSLSSIQKEHRILSDLLEAFQPIESPDAVLSDIRSNLSQGTLEYLYLGAYSYIESVLNIVCSFSFMLASESLLTLESSIISFQKFLDKSDENGKTRHSDFIHGVPPTLRSRLGASAQKILRQNWDNSEVLSVWKNKGDILEKILHIYLENCESTSDLLDDLACSVLPQVVSSRKEDDDQHGFPTLCSTTFVVWYRVLHEENLTVLNKLVKEVVLLEKPRASVQLQTVEELLVKLQHSVKVVVSLVNMCRTHHKVTVHSMAVKYGGKFVDSFLKVFDFLQAHFNTFNELIIHLVKELQKATRTIQTLCSEAKGLKQTVITSKIPATKRSMERFLFCVKALLHTTSSGCSFWMGNLKHKDLMGQVVSSQAYVDEQNNHVVENSANDDDDDDEPAIVATEDYREVE
ncbi:hypothetical protein I3760_03G190400 [Carya illinoinensis]|nr:hypothetical protein I3760_03G190400 [Carya illinoinensis]